MNGDGGLGCDPGNGKAARRGDGTGGSEVPQGEVKVEAEEGSPCLGQSCRTCAHFTSTCPGALCLGRWALLGRAVE